MQVKLGGGWKLVVLVTTIVLEELGAMMVDEQGKATIVLEELGAMMVDEQGKAEESIE